MCSIEKHRPKRQLVDGLRQNCIPGEEASLPSAKQ
jgi:hypothetical protein